MAGWIYNISIFMWSRTVLYLFSQLMTFSWFSTCLLVLSFLAVLGHNWFHLFFWSHWQLWFPVFTLRSWLICGIFLVCLKLSCFLVWTIPFCLCSFLARFSSKGLYCIEDPVYIVLGAFDSYGCVVCKFGYCVICTGFGDYSFYLWILFDPQA